MNVPPAYRWYMVFAVCLFSSDVFARSDGDRLIGVWYTERCQAAFDFYRNGQVYNARMIPLEKPDLLDTNNPVDSLKPRRLQGITAVYGLKYDPKTGKWSNGKVYNPENGKTYSCHCSLSADGTGLLFRGYLGVSLLGGSQTWTRAKCGKKEERHPPARR